ETSTDLRGGAEHPDHLASQQQLQLPRGCVAYIPRRRSAALAWQLLRGPAVTQRPDRRPLWQSLHCASARYPRLRSVPRLPKPQGKEQHQENSRSSLPFSFSPYCSLIKSTKLSQRCWHGGSRIPTPAGTISTPISRTLASAWMESPCRS